MKARYVFIALLFISPISAQTTGTVAGQIKEHGRVLASVEVRLESPDHSLVGRTDGQGNYRFENIPDGRYVLTAVGRRLNVFVSGGNVQITEISESVEISAGQEQTVEQVSKTIDVIGGQEMRDRADFALVDSLRTIPGFRVQQFGGFGRTANIKTRGLRNQDTALLIDGVRFRDVSAITGDASPFLSDLTLTSVSRVEVLRGSGSSLYGTNAIGGVIDLKTPSAKAGTHGQLSAATGGLGLTRIRGNLSRGSESGKFGVTTGLSRTSYTKGVDGDDDADNTNVQARIDALPSPRTTLFGTIFLSKANARLNVDPDTSGSLPASNAKIIYAKAYVNFAPDADDPDDRQETRLFSGHVNLEHVITGRLFLSGYYHGLSTRRVNYSGPLGPGFQSASTSIFTGRLDTANTHVNWTPRPANTVTAGYEFERERFGNMGRTPSGVDDFVTDAGQLSHTFYAQDLATLADGRLQLAGGLRMQSYRLSRPTFSLTNSPYANLSPHGPPPAITLDGAVSYYFRSTNTKLRGHVGNGYRVPSLYERFGTFFSSFGTPSFVALGDPDLKPERSTAFDLGIEQTGANQKLRASATYFYTWLRDIIGFGNVVRNIGSTTRPFGGYENQRGGIARGAEFSLKVQPTPTTELYGSYTFTKSLQRMPQVSGTQVLRTLGVPDHQFTLVVTQHIRRAWVNFDFVGTSSYLAPIFSNTNFNTYLYRFTGSRRGDLTAGYTFPFRHDRETVRVYATIENVFNQAYYENGFRTAKANGRVGLTFGF